MGSLLFVDLQQELTPPFFILWTFYKFVSSLAEHSPPRIQRAEDSFNRDGAASPFCFYFSIFANIIHLLSGSLLSLSKGKQCFSKIVRVEFSAKEKNVDYLNFSINTDMMESSRIFNWSIR